YRAWIGPKAIDRPQERTAPRSGCADLLDYAGDQLLITLPRDCAAQPETRKDCQGCGEPDRSSLGLGIQLIGLNLSKLQGALTDQLGMHLFGMLAGFELPIGNAAFIKAKSEHNRWDGTAL